MCVGALPPAGCERTEKYGRSVSYALRRLDEETPVVFHYAASEFFPSSSFSALKFRLSAYTDDKYVTQSAVCPSTTTVEAKVMTKDANLHQAVGTCVVSSFTETSLHPDLKALVPTILIDEKQFRVCLYDSEKDILLISKSKCLATKGGRFEEVRCALATPN